MYVFILIIINRCGHCKNLEPEYKIVGETFQSGDDVKIIAVDATAAPKVASDYKVQGYPTLKFFAKGSTEPIDYEGKIESFYQIVICF